MEDEKGEEETSRESGGEGRGGRGGGRRGGGLKKSVRESTFVRCVARGRRPTDRAKDREAINTSPRSAN